MKMVLEHRHDIMNNRSTLRNKRNQNLLTENRRRKSSVEIIRIKHNIDCQDSEKDRGKAIFERTVDTNVQISLIQLLCVGISYD